MRFGQVTPKRGNDQKRFKLIVFQPEGGGVGKGPNFGTEQSNAKAQGAVEARAPLIRSP
jgi:hypothetical protein